MEQNEDITEEPIKKGIGKGRFKGDKHPSHAGDFTSERAKALRAKDDPEKRRIGGEKQSITKNTKATLQRISTETQTFLKEQMLTPDGKGHIFVHDFISSFLKEAKSNPNSRAASFLAQSMFTPDLLTRLDAEADKAMAKDQQFTMYRLRNTLYDKQQEVFDNNIDRRIEIICSRRGGKCFGKGTQLRLYNGTTRAVEALQVGDMLMGWDNTPRLITSTTSGVDTMWRIKSNVGTINFICNTPHILTLVRKYRTSSKYKKDEIYDIPLNEYLTFSKTERSYFQLFRKQIDYPQNNHIIPPYLLGLWLGDGTSSCSKITVGRDEAELHEYFNSLPYNISMKEERTAYSYNVLDFMQKELRRLNLLNNKHIPQEYLIDSVENRLQLLAGLIDSDGYRPKNRQQLEFCNTNKQLIDDCLELLNSLGFHTIIRSKIPKLYGKPCKRAYTITLKGHLSLIPNRVSRKHSDDSKQSLGYGFIVEKLPEDAYYGFTVEGDGRILLSDYTVVHNTQLNARLLISDMLRYDGKKERHALYLNRNFDNAILQGYDHVVKVLDELGIPYTGSRGNGLITFTNGSDIKFRGCNNKGDLDRERGFLFSLIICDEVSAIRNLDRLFKEILEPATIDYADSRVIFTGTPPRSKHNYSYAIWHNPEWRHYSWTYLDNPFIPNREAVLDEVCKNHGLTKDAPFIQREYLSNMEAHDVDAAIFRGYKTAISPKQGTFDRAYIGVDWGYEDQAAVVSFVVKGKQMFPFDEWHASKQSISTICNEVKRQNEELRKLGLAYAPDIICDTNEKSAVYELSETYGLSNVYCAYKYDKDFALEQLAEWLRTDLIFVKKDGYLAQECEDTLWKRDSETDEIVHEIDDDNYHPNGLMALLYISRQYAYEVLGYVDTNKQATNINEEEE